MSNSFIALQDDPQQSFSFYIQPETVEISLVVASEVLPVLGTAQPLFRYLQNTRQVTLPEIKLYPENNEDVSVRLKQLEGFLQPTGEGDPQPPLLRLVTGSLAFERLWVSSFDYRYTHFSAGVPIRAIASLTLVEVPLPPATITTLDRQLSRRERSEAKSTVEEELNSRPELARSLNISVDEVGDVAVDAVGRVFLGDRLLGTLEGLVGELPDRLKTEQ